MRKLFSFLLLLIILAVAASPAITGYLGRSEHEAFWRAAAEKSSSTLQVLETKAGFLASESKMRFSPGGTFLAGFEAGFEEASGSSLKQPPTLTVTSKMFHGPYPFKAPDGGALSLAKVRSTLNLEAEGFGFKLPGYLDTTYGLTGGKNFHYHVEKGSQKVGDAVMSADIDWGKLDLKVDLAAGNDKLVTSGVFDGMKAKFRKSLFSIGKMTLSGDQKKSKFDLWTGKTDYTIDRIFAKEDDVTDNLFEATGISMNGDASIKSDLFDYKFAMATKKLDIAQARDMSFDMNMEVKNLHAPSLQKMQKVARKMQSGDAMADMSALNDMMQSANTLFSHGPAVNLNNLIFKTPAGDVEASGNFSLPPSDGGLNPFTVMMEIKGNASIKIPRLLLHRIAERGNQAAQLNMMVDQGFLVTNGDDYQIEVEFENAQLFVNNREIPVPFGGPTGF